NLNLIRANVAWTGADPGGSPLTRVPAAYRPVDYIAYGHTHVTPNNQARFRVEPDGWVYGDNPTNRVDPGRALRCTFVYVPCWSADGSGRVPVRWLVCGFRCGR